MGGKRVEPISAEALGLAPPAGHYTHAVRGGGLLFVSGQLPLALSGLSARDIPFDVQARQVLTRIVGIIEGSGCRIDQVLKVTAFIVGVENWPAFNAIYAEILGDCRPARSVVPVPALHYGWLIEVEAVAIA